MNSFVGKSLHSFGGWKFHLNLFISNIILNLFNLEDTSDSIFSYSFLLYLRRARFRNFLKVVQQVGGLECVCVCVFLILLIINIQIFLFLYDFRL